MVINKFKKGDSVKIVYNSPMNENYIFLIGYKTFVLNINSDISCAIIQHPININHDYFMENVHLVHVRVLLTEKVRPEFK